MKTRNQFKLFIAAAVFAGTSVSAQLVEEKDIAITMDLQPVLQLDMDTPTQIEFVFDDVNDYVGGITQYGATVLKVSSTVNWDLYAVGRSTTGGRFWDQQVTYNGGNSTNRVGDIPLSALELRQNQANPSASATIFDYSNPFVLPQNLGGATVSTNSIFVASAAVAGTPTGTGSTGAINIPGTDDRYSAGASGTAAGESVPGGTYLTQTSSAAVAEDSGAGTDAIGADSPNQTSYYYTIDYRILPGLPATFPMASLSNGTSEAINVVGAAENYASPGVYTMYVQYILLEDQ